MILLAVDTAFGHLGYCLSHDGEVLASHFARSRRSNSKLLLPTLDLLLSAVDLQKTDISAIVVNQGPGSYTGVRIGLSFAKTFAQACEIPLIPVPSLDVLAAQVDGVPEPFEVLLNCTRHELFRARYEGKAGTPVRLGDIEHVRDGAALLSHLTGPVLLHRLSVNRYAQLPEPKHPVNPNRQRSSFPDPALLNQVGAMLLNQGVLPDFDHVHPLYVKQEVTNASSREGFFRGQRL
ncbi:MAG TPA: tRNA (adenosine(37)-N6)-threonylcarbamoyltransferase complex dimerization subunit type 1 TsaB [Deltaproteobacteria bacterium]|nr:tRNA (adenosine(37)-N6)-threonylcarbamoyltransferase complex dimerization subunit type 1 TsaB [Deltaproteobacteria bacterium]MDE0906484.1 tRNA (adenosine(37)-N6)-threonylcarbamoyltransferase complex dimerization subunit type 1 TsaB [SAR324 cluster bacterium]HIF68121.1 tRNA (adenosine(37)-N6)-threonylcarbamoyltransferase complex dimerization subunit type 1 TsaB [Candidatus Lambdaproteobacteria bacterium]HIL15896.1 tRNA (adenosine(37)-N6)-threonylcarbamoyltransferase complex dimerization subuni